MWKICELEGCGMGFEAKRTDARFHSAICRARASRARRDPEPVARPPTRPEVRVQVDDPHEHTDPYARIRELELRVTELQADLDEVEGVRAELWALSKRVAAHDEAVQQAVRDAIAPLARQVAALQADRVTRSEFLRAIEAVDQRPVARARGRPPEGASDGGKLAELEGAVITVVERLRGLREDFDALVAGLAR